MIVVSQGVVRQWLHLGDRGAAVRELQRLLKDRDAKLKLAVDGAFGRETLAAVKALQKRDGLTVDGVVGPETWRHLLREVKPPVARAVTPPPPPPPPPPSPKREAPTKERLFIDIEWVEEETYCGGPATLRGKTKNYDNGSTEQAQVRPASGGPPLANVRLTINGDKYRQAVPVKNWLPQRVGADYEEQRDLNATAVGKKTPKPLALKFIPTLTKTECTIGISHFFMAVKNYDCQIIGDIDYVPGYMAWLIQLGDTVKKRPPPLARALLPNRVLNTLWKEPGGQTGVDWGPADPNSFSGKDWRFCKDDVRSPTGKVFWDGSAWQNVPKTWRDTNNVKLYGIGIWRDGSKNKAQFGNTWPEDIPKWSAAEQTKADSTLKTWAAKCKAAWSSHFALRRDGCPSTTASCCRYVVTASVTFVKKDTRGGHTIVVGANAGRSNAGAWSLGDTRPALAPHEFGHHLGAPDEYPGGVGIDTSVNDDGATNGIDPTSLMGSVPASSVPPIKARHLKIVSQHLSAMIRKQKGVSWTFKTVPAA